MSESIEPNLEPSTFLGSKTPMQKLAEWFSEAKKTDLQNPNAFTLATVGKNSTPHARIVLMKEITDDGLIFYTNYDSEKGHDLAANPKCSVLFFWDKLFLQVKMNGHVQKTSREKSQKYWSTRARASQISQWVSKQSHPVANREIMQKEFAKADQEFHGKDIPCPAHWGGYLFTATYVEFWIGREGRFHDRFSYQNVESKWLPTRLYP